MLFFVLSGFLLSLPLAGTREFLFREYLARRVLRIVPLYYTVLLGVIAYQTYTGSVAVRYLYISGGWPGLLEHMLFVSGSGIFWTIPAEFTFYLLLPFAAMFIIRTRYVGAITIVGVAVFYGIYHNLVYFGLVDLPSLKVIDIHKHSQFLDVFLFGVLFGVISNDQRVKAIYLKYSFVLDLLIALAFYLILALTLILVSRHFLIFDRPLSGFRQLSLAYAVIFGATLMSAHYQNPMLLGFLNNRNLVFCGVVGYSWYLLHMPVIALVNHLDLPSYLKFSVSTAVVAGVSTLTYLAIERPFITLGKHLTRTYGQAVRA